MSVDAKYKQAVHKAVGLQLRISRLSRYLREEDPIFPIKIVTQAHIASLERRLEKANETLATASKYLVPIVPLPLNNRIKQ